METTTNTRKPRAKRKLAAPVAATAQHPFRDMIRAGVPIVQYETTDPAATIKSVCVAINGEATTRPLLVWDIIRGLNHLNDTGKDLVSQLCGASGGASLASPVKLLVKLETEAKAIGLQAQRPGAIVFMMNAHRFIEDVAVLQGVWNIRDKFKACGACLVLLCAHTKTPLELRHDIMALNDPLPDTAELAGIVKRVCGDAVKAGATFDADEVSGDAATVDTLTGLNAFSAEQTTAISVRRDRLDTDTLWSRKVRQIEATSGLTVVRSNERAEDLRGIDNLLDYVSRLVETSQADDAKAIRCLVIMDEIEKMLAGAGGDTSGTSQDQLGAILRFMQDEEIPGIILVGPPGTGKTAVPKAVCNKYNLPLIGFDFGAMKGSLVGESEAKIRAALATVKAISNGKAIVIATCNKIASLPPELRRRFSLGTFYNDLPSAEELPAIWRVWCDRYNIAKQELPNAAGWTGAEIRACCDVAKRTGLSLVEASRFIVPVSKSAGDAVEALRNMASGNFISANHPGTYDKEARNHQTTGSRNIQLA